MRGDGLWLGSDSRGLSLDLMCREKHHCKKCVNVDVSLKWEKKLKVLKVNRRYSAVSKIA